MRSIAQQREANERELADMRELVVDLQKDSDHNKALGKLHHDKVNLQVRRGGGVKSLTLECWRSDVFPSTSKCFFAFG